ncbi:MAG TPA: hypothetical protein VI893_08105 [Thermoplasmata archaeon]|nr:hypothetical protein [Thermoplasmata archaeon]
MPVQRMHPSQHSERRSTGQPFAPRQRVWLSRGVVALCHWRLEHILRHCDPLDLPLANFLKEQIAAEEESADSLKRLDWSLHDGGDLDFAAKEYDQLLSGILPSAFRRTGEGLMDREAALHFVEILDAERNSFFAQLPEGPSEDLAADRLRVESDRSAERLRLVRTILLPPPQSSEPLSKPPTAEGRRAGASDRRSWVVSVSARVNQLRELHRASPSDAPGTTRPLVTDLLRDLEGAASDAGGSDEPLARRFLREFADLRKEGTRNLEDILGVARVALAWLMGGHTRRSRLRTAAAQKVNA